MDETIDIISLDNYIKKKFDEEEKKIDFYRSRLQQLREILEKKDLSDRSRHFIRDEIIQISQHLRDIENAGDFGFYIVETNDYIEKYKEILQKPLKMSFMGKRENNSIEKKAIIKCYLDISKKYVDLKEYFRIIGTPRIEEIVKPKIVCNDCGNRKNYEIIENKTFICNDCGFQEDYLNNLSSFKDVNRVNISSKYTYERRIHFRDCINQYQGKQNSTVTQEVLNDIEKQLRSHGLENLQGSTLEERWTKVSKDHILLFLKETGHTKHYEDVFLIFHKITGKKLDDISYLEPKLMEDFDKLSILYDKKFKQGQKVVTRKSFINTQYVLYQLLRRHRHQCRKEDFNILKTLDRKSWHDEICKDLFEELGWNFFPSF